MSNLKRWLLGIGVGLIILFMFTVPTPATADSATTPNPAVTTTAPAATTAVTDPLSTYGPLGGLITLGGGAILMCIKAINEGRAIDVQKYKDRAADAESNATIEIAKIMSKLERVEAKLDSVIADRDVEREDFEKQKAAAITLSIAKTEAHRKELEGVNNALLGEIHSRHEVERLLAAQGLAVPHSSTPNPKQMMNSGSHEQKSEAAELVRDATNE